MPRACAALAAPPSADRRHPHAQLRCCSSIAPRAGSPEPTRRRRARAEPRARRSLIAPPASSSARRSSVAPRACAAWPHRRAPTDVILTLSFVAAPPSHPAPAHPSRHDDARARAEPRARRSLIAAASRCRLLALRARCALARCLLQLAAALALRAAPADRTSAAGRSSSAAPHRASSCSAPLPPRAQLASPSCSPARLAEPTRRPRERRRAASDVVPDRAPPLRPRRARADRASSRVRRLAAPPSADRRHLTLSFVAAPPSHPAPAHPSRHDDGERAPSREHVVP